jgi:hypothetical protein
MHSLIAKLFPGSRGRQREKFTAHQFDPRCSATLTDRRTNARGLSAVEIGPRGAPSEAENPEPEPLPALVCNDVSWEIRRR